MCIHNIAYQGKFAATPSSMGPLPAHLLHFLSETFSDDTSPPDSYMPTAPRHPPPPPPVALSATTTGSGAPGSAVADRSTASLGSGASPSKCSTVPTRVVHNARHTSTECLETARCAKARQPLSESGSGDDVARGGGSERDGTADAGEPPVNTCHRRGATSPPSAGTRRLSPQIVPVVVRASRPLDSLDSEGAGHAFVQSVSGHSADRHGTRAVDSSGVGQDGVPGLSGENESMGNCPDRQWEATPLNRDAVPTLDSWAWQGRAKKVPTAGTADTARQEAGGAERPARELAVGVDGVVPEAQADEKASKAEALDDPAVQGAGVRGGGQRQKGAS
jgi:hypothetical protein